MMKYTQRQHAFAQYLLRRIGMEQAKDIDLYLQQLLLTKGHYHFNAKAKNPFQAWKYSAKTCVDALVRELELKKSAKQICSTGRRTVAFTATNLALYSFCPVAFSIGNSFETKALEDEPSLSLGTQLHESLRLSKQREQLYRNHDPFTCVPGRIQPSGKYSVQN